MLKRVAECEGRGAAAALEILREQERISERRTREGARLGGFVTIALGIALAVFLRVMVGDKPVYLCGLIPLLIGAAFFAYLSTAPRKQ
jgi:hypothetical protein